LLKQFKFNTATQFKNHYLAALMESGQAPAIQTARTSAKAAPAKEASVSKRGSVSYS
jgi:hypothetical protein